MNESSRSSASKILTSPPTEENTDMKDNTLSESTIIDYFKPHSDELFHEIFDSFNAKDLERLFNSLKQFEKYSARQKLVYFPSFTEKNIPCILLQCGDSSFIDQNIRTTTLHIIHNFSAMVDLQYLYCFKTKDVIRLLLDGYNDLGDLFCLRGLILVSQILNLDTIVKAITAPVLFQKFSDSEISGFEERLLLSFFSMIGDSAFNIDLSCQIIDCISEKMRKGVPPKDEAKYLRIMSHFYGSIEISRSLVKNQIDTLAYERLVFYWKTPPEDIGMEKIQVNETTFLNLLAQSFELPLRFEIDLKMLLYYVNSGDQSTRLSALFLLENLVKSTPDIIHPILGLDLISCIKMCLSHGDFETKREVCLLVTNLIIYSDTEVRSILLVDQLLESMVDVFISSDNPDRLHMLEAMNTLFELAEITNGIESAFELYQLTNADEVVEYIQNYMNDEESLSRCQLMLKLNGMK